MSDTHRFLITGGAGFLGRALIEALYQEAQRRGSEIELRVLDLRKGDHPRPIEWLEGSVTDPAALERACRDVDVVLHTAAMVDWGHTPLEVLRDVNVGGTRKVIQACRDAGVRGLVHTSTMDVVMGQGHIRDGDESLPYPDRPFDHYAATKIDSEKEAMAADTVDRTLRTCVLRPCGMYGEADPYHMSSVLREAAAGKLKFRLGDGSAVFEHVYVGNVAHGHALAAFLMLEAEPLIAGRCYLLTDQPAQNFFDFMEPFVRAWGYGFPSRRARIPKSVGLAVGFLMETGARLLRPFVQLTPLLTRSSVHILCTDIAFRTDRAERDLGYRPPYDPDEAFERTVTWFREHGPVER